MIRHGIFLLGLLVLLSSTKADNVKKAKYNVKVKGAFGINTTTAEVELDHSRKTADVLIKSDTSKPATFTGGISYYDEKENFIALQPDPLKDRCLLSIPTPELKFKDANLLLNQPDNDGELPTTECKYKTYVASDYTQGVQDAAATVCKKGTFTGVLQDCKDTQDEGFKFCALSGILVVNGKLQLGCISKLTT